MLMLQLVLLVCTRAFFYIINTLEADAQTLLFLRQSVFFFFRLAVASKPSSQTFWLKVYIHFKLQIATLLPCWSAAFSEYY